SPPQLVRLAPISSILASAKTDSHHDRARSRAAAQPAASVYRTQTSIAGDARTQCLLGPCLGGQIHHHLTQLRRGGDALGERQAQRSVAECKVETLRVEAGKAPGPIFGAA